MEYLRWLASEVVGVARAEHDWMGWNLTLALVPAAFAAVLFRPTAKRGAAWLVGFVVFLLFLPNAPYVATDIIHLRDSMDAVESGAVVLVGVLPIYATFIIVGFLSYVYCVTGMVGEAHRRRLALPDWSIEWATHLLCAVGIVLGRLARLNSWDTVASPRGTVESTLDTLTWRGAPVAVLAVLLVVWIGFALTRMVVRALWDWVQPLLRRVAPLAAEGTRVPPNC